MRKIFLGLSLSLAACGGELSETSSVASPTVRTTAGHEGCSKCDHNRAKCCLSWSRMLAYCTGGYMCAYPTRYDAPGADLICLPKGD